MIHYRYLTPETVLTKEQQRLLEERQERVARLRAREAVERALEVRV